MILRCSRWTVLAAAGFFTACAVERCAQNTASTSDQSYQYEETRGLITVVADAPTLVRNKGEGACNMLVNADPAVD